MTAAPPFSYDDERSHPDASTRAERRAEIRALSELGLVELGKASDGIHETHRAISDRIFKTLRWGLGPTVAPVKAVHDAIADGVYLVVGQSMETAGKVSGMAADLPMKQAPSSTKVGSTIIAAVNGVIGDELDSYQSPLADPLSIRVDGEPVPLADEALAAAFPNAHPRIVVAIHGLVETEHAWAWGESEPYADSLERSGVTTVFLRYNTGRHISTNGRDVAELIDDLVRRWPVTVESVNLLGHSMGGLVARSAAHYGLGAGHGWVRLVRSTVSLGTPHLGAPLEQLVHFGSAGLMKLPETRAFGRLLRRQRRLRHVGGLVQGALDPAAAFALETRDADRAETLAVALQPVRGGDRRVRRDHAPEAGDRRGDALGAFLQAPAQFIALGVVDQHAVDQPEAGKQRQDRQVVAQAQAHVDGCAR